ncbi:uncharacterized protein LOC125067046 [Vanessa atalanta]|uniref:uncharacterized protein LOC125067046 n=1 Tax=Vanessa atalanta TaxID=42275 RepID=UPI001FCCCFC8|nr:uncharacterized protein LOC125067046 [Vanessa atalanta]
MTCLPFGLAAAPRIFASVTNWTAEILRKNGLRLVVYLDDYLLVHQDRDVLEVQVKMAIRFLSNLGWWINMEKSIMTPTRLIDFLGIRWDTRFNTKSLPLEKIQKIRQKLLVRLATGSWNLEQAQRLLGYLNFATFIIHRGRLHCRVLQYHSNKLRKYPHLSKRYPDEVRTELEWWLENISQRTPIHPQRMATNHVITDASDIQWGALVNNEMVKGSWEHHQRKWHCNLKEMYAVIAAISSRATLLQDSRVILQCDNRTVVAYIKNEGGTRSRQLLDLTQKLLALVDHLNVVLLPHHLPGLYNTEADHLSRNRAGSEWHLTEEATTRLFNLWGIPDIDLFASRTAHVVSNYVTLDLLDSNACFHDEFSRSWHYRLAWLFPPPSLIPRVLGHLNSASGRYILVAPKWKKPFWRPDLKARALKRPVKIRDLSTSLVDTMTMIPPAQVSNLGLEAWLISGGTR